MTVFLDNILQLFNEHSRKIATAISILLIVIMSLSVANTALVLIETMDAPAALPQTASPNTIEQSTYRVSDLELFGRAEEAADVPEVINAPETSLNLELQGVFISDTAEDSTAIIGQKNKSGELYVIGDRLPGNAVLTAVNDDHVLLRRNGRIEKLLFSDTPHRITRTGPADNVATPAAGVRPTTTSRSGLQQIRDRIRGVPEISNQDSLSSGTASTANLEQYRQKLMEDPVSTLAEAGVTAVSEGQSRGYRVGDDAAGVVRQSGLQPGDVILSINGRPVGVASSDTALVDQVMSASRVRVEVQRDNRRFFLTVPVPK